MFILGMDACIYEEKSLTTTMPSFLRFWQFIDQHMAPPNFLILMVTPYVL